MCIGMFMALLDIQIVASSLQDIGGGLSAAQDEISWDCKRRLSESLEICMIPLSGWLTRVLSTRWLFTASAAGFTVASLLCGLAWNIESMIVFRVLQGLLGASMIPTVFTSSFHYFQGPYGAFYSAAVIGTIASVAPTLGPVIGGWITDTLNWHWLFYINLVQGAPVTILTVPFLVKIDKPDLSLLKGAGLRRNRFDGCRLVWSSLQYVLEEGARWNWFDDETIKAFTIIAGVAGTLFVVRSLTFPNPVVDLRALGNREISLLSCILSFLKPGVGIFATIYLTPLFLGYVRGYSAQQTGIAIMSTGAASLVGGAGLLIILAKRKSTCRWLDDVWALACLALSMWSFSFITHDWSGKELLWPQILRGFPQVFAIAPRRAPSASAACRRPWLKYAASLDLFNMMRNLGGSIGIAICGTLLNDRTNLHFLRLTEHLNATNAPMQAMLNKTTAHFAAVNGGDVIHGHLAALEGQL